MTVKELKEALEMYDGNAQVMLLHSSPVGTQEVTGIAEQDVDREYYLYLESE